MQQQDGLDFVISFQRLCIRIPSSHDVDAINLKHMEFNIITTTSKFKPILFTSNLFQIAFNCSRAKLFAIQKKFPLIQFHAWETRGHRSILSTPEHRSLNYLYNDKTSCLPMILELVVGMPIMCTKNNYRPMEVANGTLVMLLAISCQKLQLHII
jgi:hypothetical protein